MEDLGTHMRFTEEELEQAMQWAGNLLRLTVKQVRELGATPEQRLVVVRSMIAGAMAWESVQANNERIHYYRAIEATMSILDAHGLDLLSDGEPYEIEFVGVASGTGGKIRELAEAVERGELSKAEAIERLKKLTGMAPDEELEFNVGAPERLPEGVEEGGLSAFSVKVKGMKTKGEQFPGGIGGVTSVTKH